MLGLQGSASSTKEYQCVACSATFTGLAALLVHQTTHAQSLPKPVQKPPDSNLVEGPPAQNDEEMPKNLTPVMYVCDCGEEFMTFSDMMNHKQSHASEVQSPQPVDHELTKEEDSSNSQCDMTTSQTNVVFGADLNTGPSADDSSSMKNSSDDKWDMTTAQTDAVFGEDSNAGPSPDESFSNSAADIKQEENAAVTCTELQSPVSAQTDDEEQHYTEEMPEETEGNDMDEMFPKNKPLMKILASVYGQCLMSPPSDKSNVAMFLKEEPEQVVITPQTTEQPSTDTDMPTMQLKRPLGKAGMKTKAPSISRLLETSTKTIVSLTKIFSPVVILETRQQFKVSSSDTYGKYQCSRCRRVFQDVDSLTEHHFMHKKERIKCCRCCKQLIIGRIPLPDNHICPRSGGKATVTSLSSKDNVTNAQKFVQINPKKVFFCPVCKRNFPRRYNLKIHKCGGLLSGQSESSSNAIRKHSSSVGVGPQIRNLKVNNNLEADISNVSWALSLKQQHENAPAFATQFLQVQDSQWTAPLNTETEMFSIKNNNSSEKSRRLRLSTVLRDGVRRYSCEKCHKTFGLSSNLCRHKKVCSLKPKGSETRYSSKNAPLNANVPLFPCYVCGRNFNRKDNMITHRKKCEQRRTMIPNLASEINQSLPFSDKAQDQTQEEDEDNWSIMSLPSVLPRRVTCECGLGFTSPKLLLEHLQKHAQESYTCPTCGVTVKSWADYETHLQLHMHPLHQKRSQPLLLQFKKDMSIEAPLEQAPQKDLKNQNRKQPFECPKCGNAFASRCTLLRHLTWSQCPGDRANAINYSLF